MTSTPRPSDAYEDGWADAAANSYGCWEEAIHALREKLVQERKNVKAEEIARRAAELVGGDRHETHGDKLENHRIIADFWATYLVNRPHPDDPLTGWDAANMMELLKVARRLRGAHNPDDYIDAVGYAAIAGEIAERTR